MYACFLLQNRSDKWVGEESMFLVELHRVSLQFKIMQCRETKKKKKKETNSKRKKTYQRWSQLCYFVFLFNNG